MFEKRNKISEEKRVRRYWQLLEKELKGKEITEDTLREGFYSTTNRQDYVKAVRVLLDYIKTRKLMDRGRVEEILEQPFLQPIQSERQYHFLKDEDIRKAYEWIKEKWDEKTLMLFKLLVFSGLRFEHAVELLRTFDPKKLEIRGSVARYPTFQIGKRIKLSYYAFMPAEFARKLRRINFEYKPNTYKDRLNPKKWKPERREWQESRVSVKAIREWFQNFCKKYKVEYAYREYFMGHSLTKAGMGAERYEWMEDNAWEEYEKIVNKFPIPP
ncbi:integrase [Geoglobus ahangari]